jgi:hypothetical protein
VHWQCIADVHEAYVENVHGIAIDEDGLGNVCGMCDKVAIHQQLANVGGILAAVHFDRGLVTDP